LVIHQRMARHPWPRSSRPSRSSVTTNKVAEPGHSRCFTLFVTRSNARRHASALHSNSGSSLPPRAATLCRRAVQGIAAGETHYRVTSRQNERMSVNSVLTGLPPSYNPRSSNSSPTARPAAAAKELREKSFARTGASRVTSAEVDGPTQDAPVTSGDATDVQFHSTLDQALHEGAATAGRSSSSASEPPGGQSPAGIALYQRVSQYGNNEPQTSALLRTWNTIMQGGPDADTAAATFAKALSQSETPGSESGVLDLTA
jgi:hypothetical protein